MLLVLALASCGGDVDHGESTASGNASAADTPIVASDPRGASATLPDDAVKACDLVTAEVLRRATSLPLKSGITTNDYMGVSQCRYDRTDNDGQAIMISLHEQGSLSSYKRVPGSTEVQGVGDGAVWNPATGQLAFASGAAVISISFLYDEAVAKSDRKNAALDIARAALNTWTGHHDAENP